MSDAAELIRAIVAAGRVPDALVAEVVLTLADAASVQRRRSEPLQRANLERNSLSAAETAAIHRAADKWLTPAIVGGKSRRAWPRLLWQWLWSEERCRVYGLERRPSRRRISEALRTWTSPHGDADSRASNKQHERAR